MERGKAASDEEREFTAKGAKGAKGAKKNWDS
jgi:hypothetical protein